jgi:FkbM family methyltransferase
MLISLGRLKGFHRLFDLWRKWSDDYTKFTKLGALAEDLNIISCSVVGDLGVFEGSIFDRAVMGTYARFHTYDPHFQRLLTDSIFLHGTGTYIDIGANVGFTVIPLALARPNVSCYAIEPEPRNFEFLQNNVRNRQVKNVETLNVAIFSESRMLDFELSPQNMGDHRIRMEGRNPGALMGEDSWTVIKVRSLSLDELFDVARCHRPVMVKLDTQGSEVHAFKSGRRVLAAVDHLYAEFSPYWLHRVGSTTEEYLSLLLSLNFEAGCIEEARTGVLPPLEPMSSVLERLRDFASKCHRDDYANIFLTRGSKDK